MAKQVASDALSGEAVVCLSSIDWDFIWQQNQEIMCRCAKDGNNVLFIENTGVRAPRFSDIPRFFSRLRNWRKGVGGFRELAPNLIVLSPLLLPFPYSRLARRVNAALICRAIEGWLSASRRSSHVLWTFLPTPLVHDIAEELDPVVVYYCTADFAASAPGAAAVRRSEELLFRRADLVLVTSEALRVRAERHREAAVPVQIGIDYDAFARVRCSGVPEPADIAGIPHPRVVYVGRLHRWVDFELLAGLAGDRPTLQFVLIGPQQEEVSPLRSLPNVHLLGQKDYGALPAYIKACDVGVVPYRETDYTESVFPTELNEYLAMGLPAVSTTLPSVKAYNARHAGVVAVASGRQAFLSALDLSLQDAPKRREDRIAAARENGWDANMARMNEVLAQKLHHARRRPRVMSGILQRLSRRPFVVFSRSVLAAVAFVACVSWTPLAWGVADLLRLSSPPVPSDAIVVIGGGAGEGGVLGRGYGERVVRAVELYRLGLSPRLVLCSGERSEFSELDVMRAIALAHGVPREGIFLREKGGSTYSMLQDADALARGQGWRSVLLVSSPFHTRRATRVWQRLSPGLDIHPVPSSSSHFRRNSRYSGLTFPQMKALGAEFLAYGYYAMKGWL